METHTEDYVSLAADIVSAYVSRNSIPSSELPGLLQSVFGSVSKLGSGTSVGAKSEVEARPEPPVSIKKSITPDFLVCLEDGKHFKSLRRHLMSTYQMTPDDYRKRWDLPPEYPMVAPNYAAQRSALAKSIGLGRPGGRLQDASAPAPAVEEEQPKGRGRRKVA